MRITLLALGATVLVAVAAPLVHGAPYREDLEVEPGQLSWLTYALPASTVEVELQSSLPVHLYFTNLTEFQRFRSGDQHFRLYAALSQPSVTQFSGSAEVPADTYVIAVRNMNSETAYATVSAGYAADTPFIPSPAWTLLLAGLALSGVLLFVAYLLQNNLAQDVAQATGTNPATAAKRLQANETLVAGGLVYRGRPALLRGTDDALLIVPLGPRLAPLLLLTVGVTVSASVLVAILIEVPIEFGLAVLGPMGCSLGLLLQRVAAKAEAHYVAYHLKTGELREYVRTRPCQLVALEKVRNWAWRRGGRVLTVWHTHQGGVRKTKLMVGWPAARILPIYEDLIPVVGAYYADTETLNGEEAEARKTKYLQERCGVLRSYAPN